MTNDNLESDQAREERLREKLKRKAEVMKSKEESNSKKEYHAEKQPPTRDDKPDDPKKNPSTSSNSNSTSSKNRNRGGRNNKRRQRNERPDRPNGSYNLDHPRPPMRHDVPHNNPYRDPYGRADWRRDGPGPGYDHNSHYRRNNYHGGWQHNPPPNHNHNGYHNGYDYDHYDRPIDPYWRDGPRQFHDRDRFQHDSPRRGGGGSSNAHNHHATRKERGRSRSLSHGSSQSRRSNRSNSNRSHRSYTRSDYSRSSSRSMSRSSSRSRSSSSDASRRSSVSRSRSVSRSPEGNSPRVRKRSRSESQGSERSQGSDGRKKSRSENKEEQDENHELTKDRRTIFVSQLVMKTTERDIKKHFKKHHNCKVNDVQLLRDKRTGRHKGCAYVELGRLEDVPRAVAASGKTPEFQRFPILVKASEAEKNYGVDGMTPVEVTATGLTKRVEAQKVYIGSVDRNVTQAQLYAIFSQFGDLEKVTLQVDSTTGMSKGFAFLSYKDPKVANLAIQAMSGQVLAGRPLRTGWANLNTSVPNLEEVSSSEFPDDAVQRIAKVNEIFTKLNTTALAPLPSLSLIPGMGQNDRNDLLKGIDEPPTKSSSTAISTAAENAINAALGISSASDNLAMSQGSELEPLSPTTAAQVLASTEALIDDPKEIRGKVSKNILVRNMFDKDEETEEGWEEDIRLDFEEESSKHGKILSVKVISKEVDGKIFAKFETVEGARACAENLAGRWFDKRQLRVEFVSDDTFGSL